MSDISERGGDAINDGLLTWPRHPSLVSAASQTDSRPSPRHRRHTTRRRRRRRCALGTKTITIKWELELLIGRDIQDLSKVPNHSFF